MSGGRICKCKPAERKWHVVQRLCNHSAFSGYHRTPSSYSSVTCLTCNSVWRTSARYVSGLPDVPKEWFQSRSPLTDAATAD